MGFFGAYVFTDGGWTDFDPDVGLPSPLGSHWLSVEVHDSDFTTVRFAPSDVASGVAYLGITPRIYFEDDSASAATDVAAESVALMRWARDVVNDQVDDAQRAATVRDLLATDEEPVEVDGEVDDAEIFVELKTAKFLRALGLSLPSDLAEIER